jgi:predicted phosphodiesterase
MKTGWLVALSIIGAVTLLAASPVSATLAGNLTTYSIVHLSDTQNLATYYPATYNYTFTYLDAKKAQYNISAIVITGDLVNSWNKKSEWEVYARAVNQTTIPLYVIAGNHDTNSGKNYTYYTSYTGNSDGSYVVPLQDFDFVGINYVSKSLPTDDLTALRSAITNTSRNFTIIATHYYMDDDGSISTLGKDIDRQLIVKPTLIMGGHIHAYRIQTKTVSGYPVIRDLTDYQNGLPGSPVNKNYSAGTLYTVTARDGDVVKIMSQVIHISPGPSLDDKRVLYDVSASPMSATIPTASVTGLPNQTVTVTGTTSGVRSPACDEVLGVCTVPAINGAGMPKDQFWKFFRELFRLP